MWWRLDVKLRIFLFVCTHGPRLRRFEIKIDSFTDHYCSYKTSGTQLVVYSRQDRMLHSYWLSSQSEPCKSRVCTSMKMKKITRSIQRTQTPPRLWPLTLNCDLDLKSRSKRLVIRLLYRTLVPSMMSVSVIVCEIWPLVHFIWPLNFACDLHRPSRSLSFLSLDGRYVVYWFQVQSF